MHVTILNLAVAFCVATLANSASSLYTRKFNNMSPTKLTADNEPYLFVADGKKAPYSYVNEYGTLVGFDVDLVDAVCKLVGKQCHTVLAEFTECIFTGYKNMDYAGRGLSAQWFHGCPGYQITTDRENVFDFTLPYLTSSASFTVAPGNPSKFNPDFDDYSKFTLLHLTGAPTNGPCLTRLGKKFGKIMIAQDLPEAKLALLNGTADVLFSPRNKIDGLEVLDKRVNCDNGGAGIMLKKGSNIPSWWNPAFQTFYFSGEYTKLCAEATRKYQAPVSCLPDPDAASTELLQTLKAKAPTERPEKIWTFVVSGTIEPYSYLNEKGELVGFTKEMIETVCEIAEQTCQLTLAQVPECSVRVGELLYPGRGLMEQWFDACTGYFDTYDRDNSWDFTHPYLVSFAQFLVAPGNPDMFDPDSDDYSKFTIVFTATAISNNHCLNRLGKKYGILLNVETEPEAIALVLNGTASAWFTKETGIRQLDRLPQKFHCENVGTSVMARKGSQLPVWWNKAFDEWYNTGAYNSFCKRMARKYGVSEFPCLPEPEQFGYPGRILEGF